jgi:2-oxo-4-hydroxy-4-carboxy--5-ureidoimidazoline (OHCU) decarboxylase
MAEAGKGDKQRPTDYEKFSKNFEQIFGHRPYVTENAFNNASADFDKEYDEHQKAHRPVGSAPQS